MQKVTTENLKQPCKSIAQFYDLPNIKNKIEQLAAIVAR